MVNDLPGQHLAPSAVPPLLAGVQPGLVAYLIYFLMLYSSFILGAPLWVGGAGLGESLVVWGQQKQAAAIVLGSRGMGAVKSTLMSMVGLGSVSHYCMHHSKLPVAIVRGREGDRQKKAGAS